MIRSDCSHYARWLSLYMERNEQSGELVLLFRIVGHWHPIVQGPPMRQILFGYLAHGDGSWLRPLQNLHEHQS